MHSQDLQLAANGRLRMARQTLYDLRKLEKLKRPFPQVLFRNADGIGVHATFACGSVALSLAVQAGLSPENVRGWEISDRASLRLRSEPAPHADAVVSLPVCL